MSFYVTGDTHGDIDFQKLTSGLFPEGKKLTKKDYVLVCGDMGVVWSCDRRDDYLKKWYTSKPWTTLFIDGNHENHEALNNLPVTEWMGGRVHKVNDSIIHLMRGEVYQIDGKSFLAFGGAESHDKEFRTEGKSWWRDELPSHDEMSNALVNLGINGLKVDYIFTHCAGTTIQHLINRHYEKNRLTDFLETLEPLKFEHWYFGHYHTDRSIDEHHTAIYDHIKKLW